VLLVLSKDHKLFGQAYSELADMDGDGRVDTGFNPSVEYFGYFDGRSCYAYSGAPGRNPSPGARFVRNGPAGDDDSQEGLDAARPRAVRDAGLKAARAEHYATGETLGVCNAPHRGEGGLYSGNWLNYVTATRMDVIRKILYGGYRLTDSGGREGGGGGLTVLQSSMVPRDAHTWGTDVVSDDRWASETAFTNYYDVSKYTPFPKPQPGKAHFFARTSGDAGGAPFPIVEFILDADKGVFKPNVNPSGAGGRHYDWVLDNAPNPSSANLRNPGSIIRSFTAQAESCVKGNHAESEGCREYPNGNLKPTGLLQRNGEGGGMLFGLMTGSYGYASGPGAERADGENSRLKGGVVRNHIGDISGAVDPETGALLAGGLIRNIDSLAIAGNPGPGSTAYYSAMSWGNPVGEMLYEAVRFLARHAVDGGAGGASGPTPAFVPRTESLYNPANQAPYLKDWSRLPPIPGAGGGKPVILLIAEADSDFDGDTAVNVPGGIDRPLLAGLPGELAGELPSPFDMDAYLDRITAAEGLATSRSGKLYFYADGPHSDCSPKELASLAQVKGLCPSLPSYEGTYSSAAVAYYAHTHDFGAPAPEAPPGNGGTGGPGGTGWTEGAGKPGRSAGTVGPEGQAGTVGPEGQAGTLGPEGKGGAGGQAVDVYAVAMSGAFPPLEFPVHAEDGSVAKKISIIPGAMSSRDSATTRDRILGLLNYFILDWQADSRGTPYHVKVRVNFEDAAQSHDRDYGASDWDSDLLIEYTVDLVTGSELPYGGAASFPPPGRSKFSGALKAGGGTYSGFKAPYDGSFAIEPEDADGLVVGSWKYMSSAMLDMMGGYTVSGSTRDGTYMDIGHVGGIAKYATPPTCDWPSGYGGAETDRGSGCKRRFGTDPGLSHGDPASMKVWRSFEFDPDPASAGSQLPGPLWLAAKYGGFDDRNRNGVPDPGEFEGSDGSTPRNLFRTENISELPGQLEAAFRDIAGSECDLNSFFRTDEPMSSGYVP
jgi:hypothetical protein